MTDTKNFTYQPDELLLSEITNHKAYQPPKGYAIIYKHTCVDPTNNQTSFYIGSTSHSIKERCGSDFAGYTNNVKSRNKFATFLRKYGSYSVKKSEILRIVRADLRDRAEQEEVDKYSSCESGYNTYRVVKEVALPPKNYAQTNKAGLKNKPKEITNENLQLTLGHRTAPEDPVIINKGFYEHYFKDMVLCLDTPGRKGHLVAHPKIDGRRVTKTVLRYLSEDLGVQLKFGPDGCHMITLDNIYIVGTKTSLRAFLDQNPKYIKKVSYLAFGEWDTEVEE